ncbi:MAG: STAS domain-containing protein [Methylococcaceae bacterium]|nr:STAS domain-containing protein [Methylococcaceae bacterium]MDZ4155938.1 STAS domain-containing protein [Methylococcales bacterium]MDP2392744.1 STAS domain-containing protein [Methylococcaceae bacterium]MDP3019914.1 STAS domain-containing protein [Methylococcaceae bacterium]MDP3389909.1 STAS domain-containing protein [Methylococcaceae bacterium]
MTVQSEQIDGVLQVSVQEDMTIYNAASIKDTFLNWCNSGVPELEVDLSAVEELDSTGLQLLLSLKAESQKRAFSLRLLGHSQAVIEVFELLKLSMYFGDPVVIPADWKKS